MENNLIICGSGGQGVLLAGTVLCYAGLKENKNVTWLPSYGAEKRGGLSYCAVVISDDPVLSPVISRPSVIIALDNIGFDTYENTLVEKGMIIINTTLILRGSKRKDARVFPVPITQIAREMGNVRIANMVALGVYLGKTGVLKIDSAIAALDDVASSKYKDLVMINKQALEKGFQIGSLKEKRG